MSDNVFPFVRPPLSADALNVAVGWGNGTAPGGIPLDCADFARPGGGALLHAYLVKAMADSSIRGDEGGPPAWIAVPRAHLAEQIDGVVAGGVEVSAAGLALVLAYVVHLESAVLSLLQELDGGTAA